MRSESAGCEILEEYKAVQTMADNNLYQYLPSKDMREIRLVELKSGYPQEALHCSLDHVSLNDSTHYEALSYAWGDTIASTPLLCDGCGLAITMNLEPALKRLRYHYIPRILWVDAISIDQSRILERNDQIRIMRRIYQRSMESHCVVG